MDFSPYDRDVAIRTMIGEAGDQGPEGMAAVANVLKNRVQAGFGDSLSDVALQNNGKTWQFEPWSHPDVSQRLRSIPTDSPEYQGAAQQFDNVASGQSADNTNGATHFFAPQLQSDLGRSVPSWAKSFTPTAQIGGHNFYQDPQYSGVLGAPSGSTKLASLLASRSQGGNMAQNTPVGPQAMGGNYNQDAIPQAPIDMTAIAQALIKNGMEPSNSPGPGTTFERLANLLDGRLTQEKYGRDQRAYNNQIAEGIARPGQQPVPIGNQGGGFAPSPVPQPPRPAPMQPMAPQGAPGQPQAPVSGQPIATPALPVSPDGGNPQPAQSGPRQFIPPTPGMPPLTDENTIQAMIANPATREQGMALLQQRREAMTPKMIAIGGQNYTGTPYTGFTLSPIPNNPSPEKSPVKAGDVSFDVQQVPVFDPATGKQIGVKNLPNMTGSPENGQPAQPGQPPQSGAPSKPTDSLGIGPMPTDPAQLADWQAKRDLALNAQKAYTGEQAKAYSKKATQIETNSTNAQNELPQLQVLQKLIQDPNFYSGFASGNVRQASAAAATLGLGTGQTAAIMDFAKKLGSAGSLDTIKEMAQFGAVRIPEMHMIEKSNFDVENMPASNAAVVEIRARAAQRSIDVADMAQKYADAHGGMIDRGFDQQMRQYAKEHPLFSDQEIENYNQILGQKKASGTAKAPPAGLKSDPLGLFGGQ